MKIGVSSYSFGAYMGSDKLGLFGVIDKAAEMGFEGIEFTQLPAPEEGSEARAYARSIRDACDKAGLPVINYAVGANFLSPDGPSAEAERLKPIVRFAAELGCPVMRHDAAPGFPPDHKGPTDFAAALPILADGCRAVTEFAAALGVRTTVENHGFFVQDSVRCEQLMRAVDHENFGSLIDIGNFLCADDDPVAAAARMAPWAFHVHAKDFHVKPGDGPDPGKGFFRSRGGNYLRGAIVGHGNVDVPACLGHLKKAGYDGWLAIEFEGMEDNIKALEIGLENLRRYWG